MTRGGKRLGAGRPKNSGRFPGASKTMRIPLSHVPLVKTFLATQGHALLLVTNGGHAIDLSVDNTRKFHFIGDAINEPKQTVVVAVGDDSMQGANIHSGDLLIVDTARAVQEADLILVVLQEKFAVKRYHRTRTGHVLLGSESKGVKSVIVAVDELQMLGVVTHMIHKF